MRGTADRNGAHGTLADVLASHAAAHPERRAFSFLRDAGGADEITYAELHARARRVAAALSGLGHGARALLLLPPSAAFVEALFGCFHAGVCAVPAHVPTAGRLRQTLPRLSRIAADARPDVVLATAETMEVRALVPELATLPWIFVDALEESASRDRGPSATSDDLAILQYSSGSTGTPRGVMVSHRNLMHNEALIEAAFEHTPSSVVMGWLPFQHDMGLIGNVIQPVFAGAECVLMTPIAFLKRPLRWLRAISERRATTSGAPNFAYAMCVEEARRARHGGADGLDLSSWSLAFVGAEPVRAGTLESFARAFAPSGFRREAFYPCYGLAEATLMVTGGLRAEAPRERSFAGGGAPRVSCGPARPGLSLAIVDVTTERRARDGDAGEIWVQGSSVAKGYFGDRDATHRTFGATLEGEDGTWLRTGDLGCLVDGELYVTGRLKDVVVVKGAKHAAEDIEAAVDRQDIALLRKGACAAFGYDDGESERLIVVHEVERAADAPWSDVAQRIAAAVVETQGTPADVVSLVRAGSIPRTTSGKVRRGACRELFAQGSFDEVLRYVPRFSTEASAR